MPSKRRYGQLGRLFRISKFVGLFPYDGRYTLSWTGLLYSLSILAAVSASLYNEILIFTSIAIAWYGIMLFYLLEYSAMLVLCYALIIKSVFNGKDVGKIFESFERVDLSLGTSLTEDNIRIYPIVINVFILFPICLDFRRNLIYTSLTDSLPNIFFITATFSLSVTVETQFDLLLRSISRRLEHCRTALRRIPHSSNDIDRVIDTYGVLVDQVSRINDMYSPQMLLIISWIFVEIVHVEYSAISERADGSGLEVRRALLFLWVFSRFAQLTNIINICSSTSQKVRLFLNRNRLTVLRFHFIIRNRLEYR